MNTGSVIPRYVVECPDTLLAVGKSHTALVYTPEQGEIVPVHKPSRVPVYRGEENPAAPEALADTWDREQQSGDPIVLTVRFTMPGPRTHGYACFVPSEQGWDTLHSLGLREQAA